MLIFKFLSNTLKSFDNHGEPISLNMSGKTKFKTKLGGFIGLIIYTLITYFTYIRTVKMINKVHKKSTADPTYGLFMIEGKVIEYQVDGDLRDHENVPLDPSRSVNEVNEEYFVKEVQPHVPEAWIDSSKKDNKDGEIGIVGYEIPFNRHFYVYQPPRDLVEIDADLDKVSAEIMQLLREVHS